MLATAGRDRGVQLLSHIREGYHSEELLVLRPIKDGSRAVCPRPPVDEAGVFPPKPPGFEKPVEAFLFEEKPSEQILGCNPKDSCDSSVPTGAMKKGAIEEFFFGKGLYELGHKLHQWVLEVSPLRGKSMGKMKNSSLFPLPTSRKTLSCSFSDLADLDLSWLSTLCVCLNSFLWM